MGDCALGNGSCPRAAEAFIEKRATTPTMPRNSDRLDSYIIGSCCRARRGTSNVTLRAPQFSCHNEHAPRLNVILPRRIVYVQHCPVLERNHALNRSASFRHFAACTAAQPFLARADQFVD